MTSSTQHLSSDLVRESVACYLPIVRSANPATGIKRRMTSRLAFNVLAIQKIAENDQDAITSLLQSAWALVLYYYTGLTEVCFGYDEFDLAGSRQKPRSSVARTRINDNMSPREVLDDFQGKDGKYGMNGGINGQGRLKQSQFHYNTTVTLQVRSSATNAPRTAALGPSQAAMVFSEECKIRVLAKYVNSSLSIFLEWRHPEVSASFASNVSHIYSRMLNSLTNDLDSCIQSLCLITPDEKDQIMKWNAVRPETVDRCIHQIIEDQVSSHPEKEAVCAWDGSLTYFELDQLATKLALYLMNVGVGPETRVALCFDKSKWNIVAMLAVLKAGGAFVPLDPTHPIARLRALVQAVEAKVTLCSTQHASRLEEAVEKVVALDGEWLESLIAAGGKEQTGDSVHGKNAAYVLFTSGSTGEPKGTVVEHQAFCSGARAHGPAILIDSDSRVLQFAAHTFDASLAEILTPLMCGACVCIPSEDARLNGIVPAINEMRVNHASLTPSFIRFIEPAEVPGLSILVLVGEALTQANIETWSSINLVNGYGPTESSVVAVVNSNISSNTASQDIGFPVAVRCWVVDPENHDILLPIGCTGELLLEGPSLARCYLNNAEKTAQAFIFDPAWSQDANNDGQRRFYKTGDLVRYNSDAGSFDFVGRKDTQVKFHGQRIELGEIESHLIRHSATKHGLVLLPKSGPVAQKLVAIVSLSDSLLENMPSSPVPLKLLENATHQVHISNLREQMGEILPSYMVPSIWVCVEAFPVLASRKLDRRTTLRWLETLTQEAIDKLLPVSEEVFGDFEEEMTDVESKIRQIWSRVLNISLSKTSLNHSFLSLGGDSITAMTCMNQCKKAGLGFSVQEILRSKSIKELANCVKPVGRQNEYHEEIDKFFDLSPIQKLHFHARTDEQGHFNQSFFLRLNRQVTEQDLLSAITTIIKRHSMLRGRFSYNTAQKKWEQRITSRYDESYRFRVHQLLFRKQAKDAIAESQASLNAVTGLVLSVDLFYVKDDCQLLSLVAHHLVIDLVSWRVILEDLEELLTHSASLSLLEPTLPFQDWCQLQAARIYEAGMIIDNVPLCDLSYWGMSEATNTYGEVACDGFELDPKTTALVMGDSNFALRTETVDLLVASLLYSFRKTFPDHNSPVVHNEGHGRETWDEGIDISRTVGWFTIIYPVFVEEEVLNGLVDTLVQVKDRRRQVEDNGREYFANSILTGNCENQYQPMEISFNYLGRYQQLERAGALFQPVEGLAGETSQGGGAADFGKNTPRFGLFEISAVVVQDVLRFTFSFNGSMRHQKQIRSWITSCREALCQLSNQLVSLKPRPTISDFPLLSLNYTDLSALTAERLPALGIAALDEVEDIYPCSPMQRGLMISTSRNSSFYAVRGTYEIKSSVGQVDAQLLAQAWQRVIDRHAMLRTLFVENLSSDDIYSQVVLHHYAFPPKIIRSVDDNEVLSVFDTHIMEFNNRKPLHQFTICETNSGRLFCRLEMSHAIMDGTSISLILRDLQRAYSGKLVQGPNPLFSKFISYLNKQPRNAAIDYWKTYLSGVEPCHISVLNDGHDSVKQYTNLRLDFQGFGRLQETCEKYGLTVANALHGAWALTLRCFTGSEDVCFGYLISERDAPIESAEEVIGPLINMLACRINMPSDATVNSLLERIQGDYMNSLPFKHFSLADVQHELGLSGTALFNTCFSYRKLPPKVDGTPIIQFSECGGLHDPTEYLVTINVEATDKEAVIDLDYWTDLLSTSQAANIAQTFIKALENIISYPETAVGDLDYMSSANWQQVSQWNNSIPETIKKCIHEVFKEQVQINPNAPAICSWDGHFTYSEVDALSSRLAGYLSSIGVEPESFVALCFDKSAYTIVSMIAVLKAGGGCVPLDAGHPKTALDLRVLESGANVVLSSPSRAHLLEDIVPYAISVDESLFEELETVENTMLNQANPENAAFLIFTSGSTGNPKGVVLEHQSLVTSAAAHGAALGVDSSTRFLQFASYSFDNSLEEIFTPLMRGGCVCVPSESDRMNNLAKAINDLDVNFTDMTATVASFLQPSDVPKLKGLAIGGEAPTKEIKDTWTKVLRLQNIYGPTECSINCCHNADVSLLSDVTNIGRAVGCLTWVVNPSDHNHLVPIGCVGELLIEGPILARHYLNNPEKTQQSFIENPTFRSKISEKVANAQTATGNGHRMYKTGDLVRYNSDGSLVYLGRKDTQVKLNGQRIELGEIEHRMQAALPAESQCSVDLIVTRNGSITSKALVAFVCLQAESKAQVHNDSEFILSMSEKFQDIALATKSTLISQLQSYMVPNVYIPVSFLPMTSSGKLNRRLLRVSAEEILSGDASAYRLGGRSGRAPSTDAEKVLQRLWVSVLSVDASTISAEDTFFRHGGDSISAIKLVTAARKEGYTIGVADILKTPMLSEMAQSISGLSSTAIAEMDVEIIPFSMLDSSVSLAELKDEVSTVCRIPADSIEDIYPCTAIQEGLIALSNTKPGSYVTQNVYELTNGIDIAKFKQAWEKLAYAEAILRTRIVHSKSGGFLQVVVRESLEWESILEMSALSSPSGSPLATNGGRLSRYTIVGESSNSPRFVWTAHHAVYDGWSMPILLDKLRAYYEDGLKGAKQPNNSYLHFIKYLASVDSEEAKNFWTAQLDGLTRVQFPALPNASYKPSPKNRLTKKFRLPTQSRLEATLPSIVRAAWTLTSSVFSFSEDVIFGEIMTGRDAPVPGIADIIGPILSIVPMRLQIDLELTVAQFLQSIQKQAASLIPYQFTGLQNIRGFGEDAKAACDFQTLFSIAHGDSDDIEGIMSLLSANSGETNFYTYPLNVSCFMWESELEVQVHYDQNVLPEIQLERMLNQFKTVLAMVCSEQNREEKIGNVEIVSTDDLSVIQNWNAELSLDRVDKCIYELIDENTKSQPDAPAVSAWDGSFTYRELDEHSTILAHHIAELVNGKKESFIPVCFEKSAFAIVSMLAIMKAGCAFVPLDPQHPVVRRREIIVDIEADLILCSPKYLSLCKEVVQQTLAVDMSALTMLPNKQVSLKKNDPSSAAYVIFTSGSTGKPKGCIIEHVGFCSGAVRNGPAFSFGPSSRVLQFASYTFDASILETLTVLVMGGCVCVPHDNTRLNGIAQFINEKTINTALLTPSMAQTIKPCDVPGLKNLALVGEAMAPNHLTTWANELRLINGYGPTETSIVAAVKPRMVSETSPSNIGTAVGNAWLVDPGNHNRLMPVGAIGELLIEGPTLARGYLNNVQKTAEVFIKNPTWATHKSIYGDVERRMYRTGDLVKYAPDNSGELIYIGRKDNQAKIHGQRLELEEIEHHLNSDGEILNAVVFVPKSGKFAKKLVAVLSLRNQSDLKSESGSLQVVTTKPAMQKLQPMRDRLGKKVPGYMVPSNWIIFEQLPLLASGKLNRRMISQFIENTSDDVYTKIMAAAEQDSPGKIVVITETEATLQKIWASVLNIGSDSLSLDRSFIHLGGDSMSAMAVMSKCRSQHLGVTVENIITCKSIRHLATLVTSPKKAILEEENFHEFDLSPIQTLYFRCMERQNNRFNQSMMMEVTKPLHKTQLRNAITRLVKMHPMLRARFSRDGNGIWKQRITSSIEDSYLFRTVEYFDPGDVPREVEDVQGSLNIVNGPVIGVMLVDDPSSNPQILICVHHLVIDVVSWGIIMQDLEDILQERLVPESEATSFQKWSKLQVDFAKQNLSTKVLPLDDMPTSDFEFWGMENIKNTHGDVVTEEIKFEPPKTRDILELVNGALGAELVDILLASLLLSFRRVFPNRKTPPCIYNEGHGREPWDPNIDLSRTVGWFTTLSPVRLPSDTESNDGYDFRECIHWVKDIRKRTPGKGMPYFAQRFLTWEGSEKHRHHWPMEIVFNYLGQHKSSKDQNKLLRPINGTGQAVNSSFDIGAEVPRFSLIEISAIIVEDSLSLSFSYNKVMKRQTGIGRWVRDCKDLLCDALVDPSMRKLQPSLSDFPLLPLSFNSIKKLKQSLAALGIQSFDEIEDIYPSSPMQDGILLSQLRDATTYSYKTVFEVDSPVGEGMVDIERLSRAWQKVADRHSALRTIFVDGSHESSLMNQIVFKPGKARIVFVDASEADARESLSQIPSVDFKDSNPPHRLAICKTKSGKVFCRFDISNAIADGSSMPIIIRDLSRAYMNLPPATSKPPKYGDFIAHLQTIPKEKGIEYWKQYLSGAEPCFFPSLVEDNKGEKALGSEILILPDNEKIGAFCREMGITMSALFQLSWALLLRTYTGSDEVCFGYVASGRDIPVENIQDAVGAFINMLVYKIVLKKDMSLQKALKKTQLDFVKSMEYQSISLAEVQHELGLGDTSLFNTAFTFQRRGVLEEDTTLSLSFKGFDSHDPSEYKLAVNVEMLDTTTEVHFSFWRDYLSDIQAKNIADTFEKIINDIANDFNPTKSIGDVDCFGNLSCISVYNWNRDSLEKTEKCVHELIEEQSLTQPSYAQAIEAWDSKFTYQELNIHANRLAKHLQGHGVGPEVVVPLFFEKSAWAIVAQIAVLKAGGAFVSFDPSHPEDRIRSLIEDVQGHTVLTSAHQYDKISQITKNAITVSEGALQKLPKVHGQVSSPVKPHNTAYIIFTSGSTGKPKGTVIEHGQFCTAALAHGNALHMDSKTRSYQFASYTFDASILDILSVLVLGGCVCVPSAEERMNDIAGSIGRLRANWMCITPSVASTLKPESIPTMKVIAMGGEKLTPGSIEKWSKSVRLVEAYGPSECSVVCAAHDKVDLSGNIVNFDPAVIGRAVGGRSWIVDQRDYNKLVPIGAIGELVIEGHTVGRGYLNNEKKTKEVFIKDPTWATNKKIRELVAPGSRMYRTGDLVRYNTDGTITYMARMDMQIKLNGQRIELGEIEYQCAQHMPQNLQLAVDLAAPGSQPGAKKLAMFFTPHMNVNGVESIGQRDEKLLLQMNDSIQDTIKTLEVSLAKVLPSYMIPKLFFPVSSIPFTTSGKLDRQKLHGEINDLSRDAIKTYSLMTTVKRQAPTDKAQLALQILWAEILSLPTTSIGSEDSFFRLGGDSLAAMKLVGMARSRNITLSVLDVFRHPSLKEMSSKCKSAKETLAETKPFSLLRGPVSKEDIIEEVATQCSVSKDMVADVYPCSPLQEGLITSSVKQRGAYVAQNVLRLAHNVDIQKFKAAWQQLTDEFDILRTRIVHTASSNFLQVVLRQHEIVWHHSNNLEKITKHPSVVPESEGGPLTRYILVEDAVSSDTHFVWSIHHALYDAWGLGIILKRVQEIYFDNPLFVPVASFAGFIDYLQRQDLSVSDNFWKSYLADVSPTPFPPTNKAIYNSGKNTSKTLSTITDIKHKSLNLDITTPTLIRAAWALVLSNRTQSDDVCFGETLSGRNVDVNGIADLAGPALTTVPTRVKIDSTVTKKDYLREMQRISTDMIPYQHCGLQHIRRLGEDAAAACDFQNLIIVQTAEAEEKNELWEVQNDGALGSFFTYPLVVECKLFNSHIELNIHFDEEIISTWDSERILMQFSYVLQQLASGSSTDSETLDTIGMVSPEDKEDITWWNRRRPQVVDQCIHDLFRHQAFAHPKASAIHSWDGNLTYEELKIYASQLASDLKALDVKPEVLVPLCLDKSAWTIVAMFAVLMAGGAIVPLDPKHPLDRHTEIIGQIKADIILCAPQYRSRYDGLVNNVVVIDESMIKNLAFKEISFDDDVFSVSSSNSAYVIFTSGSTGKPKGITIEHRAFSTSSAAFGAALRMDSKIRTLQFASLSFDAAMMEIFTTLTVGGCVCVPNEEERLQDLPGVICRMNVSWTLLTPSVANLIDPSTVPCLKVLACGGEAMSPETISKWTGNVELVNAYGPTEASVVALVNPNVSNDTPSNIGCGTQPTLTWIVNPENHEQLTPLGAVGELALEGPTLARGYLGDDVKTKAAFVDNPSWTTLFPSTVSGSQRRLHLTGDLVKYIPDGSINFVGRKDSQVKINGQRIDLGEIEHRLETDPRIRHVIVLFPKSGHLQKRLVAVISLSTSNKSVSSSQSFELVKNNSVTDSQLEDIKHNLSLQLPSYMLPHAWAIVNTVPMLVSGKLDRKSVKGWIDNISESTSRRIMRDEESNEPHAEITGVAAILRDVWGQVLNLPIEKVKLNQSFMSLGGDSITAMAVVSRSRRQKIGLSLHDVLRSTSIVQLASTVEAGIVTVQSEEKMEQDFELSPIQKMYFKASKEHQGNSRFNQSFSLRLSRYISPQTLCLAIRGLVDHHSMLKARFRQRDDGEWVQLLSNDIESSFIFNHHLLSTLSEATSIIAQSQKSINISRGPLFTVDMLETQDNQQFLFMVAHHLIIDMVSWRIIIQDLQDMLETGSAPNDKPLSFQTWCTLQTEHVRRDDKAKSLPFQVLPGNLGYWGMENIPNKYGDALQSSFSLTEETTSSTMVGSHNVFRTDPVDILLSAIIHSFHCVFNDRFLPTLFNEGHGRESWDSENDPSRTVGWFTNISPLQVSIDSDNVLNTLKRVKDTRRSVQEIGKHYLAYSLLAKDGQAHPVRSTVPMEILFNYLGGMQQLESDDSLLQSADIVPEQEDPLVVGDMGPDTTRLALFEISAIVVQGRLQFTFMYNRHMRHVDEIRRWISECKWTLEEIIIRLRRCSAEPTLSDYPLLPVNYDGMKRLIKEAFPKAGISHRDQVEDIYPCSPTQEGMLLSQLRDPSTYLFHVIFEVSSVNPREKIQSQRLIDSWQKVIDRHAALRTIFINSTYKGGAFDQLVLRKVDSEIVHINCDDSQVIDKLQSIKLHEINTKRKQKIPHQMAICNTFSGKVFIKLEINHAVIDGGSTPILIRDLSLAYDGQLLDGSGPLYSDYIQFIRSNSTRDDITFWKRYLAGVQVCHFPRLTSATAGERRLASTTVNFKNWSSLQKYCEESGFTLANVIQAAWALVLRKYTGSDDVCFGYLSAGRDAPVPGIQDSIGVFINMLCCRVRFSGSQLLAEIPGLIQDDYVNGIPHQRCSLAQVQHELGLQGKKIFNTALSIQNHSIASDSVEGSLIFTAEDAHDPSEYPITLNIETAREEEGIIIRYWTDIISSDQASGISEAITAILQAFANDPTETVSRLNKDVPQVADVAQKQRLTNATSHQQGEEINQLLENHPGLQALIDERVQTIVQQMFSLSRRNSLARRSSIGTRRMSVKSNFTDREVLKAAQSESDAFSTVSEDIYSPDIENSVIPVAAQIHERGRQASLEEKLLRLWSEKLEIPLDSITKDDSFFDLGGDSITAMALVGDARDVGLVLTVADVFRNPIFKDMATAVQIASDVSYVDIEISNMNRLGQPSSGSVNGNLYERFALLKSANIDEAFLQKYICPRVGVFKGGIADILPVTDFQALSITGALLQSRWMLNFFCLDGHGPLDFRRLKQSCFRVVHAFDILRTVFVASKGRFLQVILRKIRPEFYVYETDESLDEFTSMLQQRDIEQGVKQGEPFTQFYVVKEKNTDRHRIILRLSHAQYDGVSLPRILSAIKAGYEGGPIPSPVSFANFVRDSARLITTDHHNHWRTLLKDSKMTELVRRQATGYRKPAGNTTTLRKTVHVPPMAHGNITTATVIKAAWALTLARVTGSADVVFGHTISGRNTAAIAGVESMVGPCMNIIPVRVKFGEKWTILELLRYVQDQQLANMPYEALGFRHIIHECTDWPNWTSFSTVLQHDTASSSNEIQLGENTYVVKGVGSDEELADFSINSRSLDKNQVEMILSFSMEGESTMPLAQRVLDMVCDSVESFTKSPNMALPSPTALSSLPKQHILETEQEPTNSGLQSSQLAHLSRAEILVLSDVLRRAWEQVLADNDNNSPPLKFDSSFFDLGGDLIALAQVSWLLEQEDLKAQLDDLIECPTMMSQMTALVQSNSDVAHKMMTTASSTGNSSSATDVGARAVQGDLHPLPRQSNKAAHRRSVTWASAVELARKIVKRRLEVSEN
ncbi:putative nonribosomal peptide synthase [Talaromyces proteolyticus]|uniref:Nonribosomal peptide synthase n=1 Tax=Talaromyces proteolyticus TaxID=1131652 RepID=A0AAD4KX58_9EURO|nr:putative nonribosomal peptide synthase [Talaromyces proteolyticus]KAH8701118.1 putative nonribosomal peptide synthase [Talaromyces proteolyticus]